MTRSKPFNSLRVHWPVQPRWLAGEVYQQPSLNSPFPEGYEFWLQAMAKGYRCRQVNRVMLDWINDATRTTRNDPRYHLDGFDHCRGKVLLCAAPWSIFGARDRRKSRGWGWLLSKGRKIRQLIDVSPKEVGQTIHGTKVMSSDQILLPNGTPLLAAMGPNLPGNKSQRSWARPTFGPVIRFDLWRDSDIDSSTF
ncbi:MAG: hypothetical protein M2R45_05267 [Verrucomicrobia subdivision 3 bacterium]|nr:hypothetical protein [Limisphaerales bacterium]MCS1412688.1 hypothetical protein [Limisphaerales bacterium]